MPKVSVIVISFNTSELLDKCLSLIDKTYEIIVVDNASTDGSSSMVKKKYKHVNLIESYTNLGFGAANNLAMKIAKGDYLLLLNSDAFLESDTILKCLDKSCDVLGSKLVYVDGRLQPSAGSLPNPSNIVLWLLGLPNNFHPKKLEGGEVGWITGAFMFLRREVFEKTGGFDEKFFMYGEEVEWCKRMKDSGYKVYYDPSFQITHLQGASGENALIREMEGIKYYFQKHHPAWLEWLRFWIFVGSFLRWLAFGILGNKNRSQAYQEILTKI